MQYPRVKANVDGARRRDAAKKQEPSTTTEIPIEHDDSKTFAIRWCHGGLLVTDHASSYRTQSSRSVTMIS